MEKLELILSLAGAAIGLLITTLTFVVKFCKSVKARKVAEQTIEIANAVLPYIEQAEKFINFSGEEKKEYVMTKANQYAIAKGIEFDAEAVSNKVEELIFLTKQVNIKAKSNPNISGNIECFSGSISVK